MSGFSLAEGYVELSQKGFSPVSGAIDSVTGKLKKMGETPMHGLESGLDKLKDHFADLLSPMGLLTEALAALGAGLGIGALIEKANELETTRLEFDQLTRSVEGTDKLLGALKKQFVGTGINPETYKEAAKEMLQMGESADEIPAKLKALGNISAATGEPINAMASAMRRAELTGKVTSRTIMMMGPSIQNMLKQMYPAAEAMGGLEAMADSGQIGIKDLQQAVENLGGETGMYANMLAAKQSSMSGQWDILKSNVGKVLTNIGEDIVEAFNLKGATGSLSDFVANFQANYGETIKNVFVAIHDAGVAAWDWITRMWDAIGGMKTVNAYLEYLNGLWDVFTAVVETAWDAVSAGVEAIMEVIGAIFGLNDTSQATFAQMIQHVFGWAAEGLHAVASFVRNFGLYMQLVWEHIKLAFSNGIEYVIAFGKNVGRIFMWCVENAGAIFSDIGSIIYHAIDNTIHNIMALWNEFWAWLKSGGTKKWSPDTRSLLDGYKSSIKTAVPELASANIQQTNAAIDKINNELAAREIARADKEAAKKTPKPGDKKTKQQEEREKWIKPGGPVAPGGAGAMATQQKIEFVGLSQLAEKMQQEAAKNDIAQEHLGVAKNQAGHMQALAGCVQNGGLNVNVPNAGPQHWGA